MIDFTHFCFEPISHQHTPFIIKWRNDPNLNQFFMNSQKLTPKSQRQFLKDYSSKDRLDLVLIHKPSRRPVGVFSVKNISTQPEIGQLIGEADFRGKGIGKSATWTFIQFCFLNLDLPEIFMRIKENNSINLRLTKKLGFIPFGKETIQNERYVVLRLRRKALFRPDIF